MKDNKVKKNKVTMVANYYPPHIGGLEVVAQKQAESLASLGYEVSVVTFQSEKNTSFSTNENGVTIFRIKGFDYFDTRFGIPFVVCGPAIIARLRQEISKSQIVHIHDVFYPISWVACLVASFYKKPIIITQHVGEVYHTNPLVMFVQRVIYGLFGRKLFKVSSTIVVYNKNVKSFLQKQGVDMSKVVEMKNGINTSLFYPVGVKEKVKLRKKFNLPEGKRIALFVGRLVPKKGFDLLYETHCEDFDLVFVGNGNIPDKWKSIKGVHFLGPIDRNSISEVYQLADIFVFPSTGELFTLAMQEAMLSGLPIITTNDPGYRSYNLNRNLIGFTELKSSSIKKLLIEKLKNKKLLKQMSFYSLKLSRKWFDWDKNFKTMIKVYDNILNERKYE